MTYQISPKLHPIYHSMSGNAAEVTKFHLPELAGLGGPMKVTSENSRRMNLVISLVTMVRGHASVC